MVHLCLREITKRFGGATILERVSLEVADGEFLVLVGPSGCGKSTLLRVVAGLEAADEGDILLDGARVNDLEPIQRDAALVFQNYALYPHMTVRGNLAFPLKMASRDGATIEAKVRETAQLLGLVDLLGRKPGTLSGGEMQRVALGRAIVRSPRLFLFDEPLSNLDAKLRAEMRAEIARLHRRLGVTTLYVTHDQAEAMTMGSRICVLDHGRVQQIGTPMEVFERPATSFVASFIGSPAMNLLRGRVEGGRFRLGSLEIDCPFSHAGEILLGIRPHQVELGGASELPLTHVERLGGQTHLHLDLAGQTLLATREGDLAPPSGQPVRVSLPAAHLHWFDATTGMRRGVNGAPAVLL